MTKRIKAASKRNKKLIEGVALLRQLNRTIQLLAEQETAIKEKDEVIAERDETIKKLQGESKH